MNFEVHHNSFLDLISNLSPLPESQRTSHKKKCTGALSQFFSPIQRDLVTRERLAFLADTTVAAIDAVSQVHAEVLKLMISKILRVDCAEGDVPLTTAEKVLFVILKTSPAVIAASSGGYKPSPCLWLSPATITITQESRSVRDLVQWTVEVDPISSAIVAPRGDSDLVLARGAREFENSTLAAKRTSALLKANAVDEQYSVFSSVDYSSPWFDDLDLCLIHHNLPSERDVSVGLSSTSAEALHDGEVPPTEEEIEEYEEEPYRMPLFSVMFSEQFGRGAIVASFIALHHAAIGEVDPYGLVQQRVARLFGGITEKPIPAEVFVCPMLLDGPGNAIHAVGSVLEHVCRSGSLFLRLSALVEFSTRAEAKHALGGYGAGAVSALRFLLARYRSHVIALSARQRPEPVNAQFNDILSSLSPLNTLLLDIDWLAEFFHITSAHWRCNQSIPFCSSATLLSRLYEEYQASCTGYGVKQRVTSLSGALLAAAMKPLNTNITQWIHTCTFSDPYDEFFIVPSYGTTASGFKVDNSDIRLPVFISEEDAGALLNAGLGKGVLKEVSRDMGQRAPTPEHATAYGNLCSKLAEPGPIIEPPLQGDGGSSRGTGGAGSSLFEWEEYFISLNEILVGVQNVSIELEGGESSIADADASGTNPQGGDDEYAGRERTSPVHSLDEVVEVPDESDHSDVNDAIGDSVDERNIEEEDADALKAIKDFAKARILKEHNERMKALQQQEKRLDWKGRRMALQNARIATMNNVREVIEEQYHLMKERGSNKLAVRLPSLSAVAHVEEVDLRTSTVKHLPESVPPPPSAMDGFLATSASAHSPSPAVAELPTPKKEKKDEEVSPRPLFVSQAICQVTVKKTKAMCGRQRPCPFHDREMRQRSAKVFVQSEEQYEVSELAPKEEFTKRPEGPRKRTKVEVSATALIEGEVEESQPPPPPPPPPVFPLSLSEISYPPPSIFKIYPVDTLFEEEQQPRGQRPSEDQFFASYFPALYPDQNGLDPSTFVNPLIPFWENHNWFEEKDAESLKRDAALFSLANDSDNEDALMDSSVDPISRSRGRSETNAKILKIAELGATKLPQYYNRIASLASAQMAQQTLGLLLEPFGALRVIVNGFCDVCLMQDGVSASDLMHEWEMGHLSNACVDSQGEFDAHAAFLMMHRGFASVWDRTEASSHLTLRLTASSLASGVDIPATPLALLHGLSLKHQCRSEAQMLLFPDDSITRYADLFVTLASWRWVEGLLKSLWRKSMQLGVPEAWVFQTLCRTVFNSIVSNIWYSLSSCKKGYVESLEELSKTSNSLTEFTEGHEVFLSKCCEAAMLTPEFARVRRIMWSLVRTLEEVERALLHPATQRQGGNDLLAQFIKKRVGDFVASTELFIRHVDSLNATNSSASTLPQLLATLTQALHTVPK